MKRYVLFPIIILALFACKKSEVFPYYPVFLEFNISAYAPELNAFNGFKEFTAPQNYSQRLGLGGVLVFHTIEDKFVAFDMACPYEKNADTKVRCDNSGVVVCDSCSTRFFVGDGLGFVLEGVSRLPLKKYEVFYSASQGNILVRN